MVFSLSLPPPGRRTIDTPPPRLLLSTQVAKELESHLGVSDKDLAEFIIELSKSSSDAADFGRQLKENDADLGLDLTTTLWQVISRIVGGGALASGTGAGTTTSADTHPISHAPALTPSTGPSLYRTPPPGPRTSRTNSSPRLGGAGRTYLHPKPPAPKRSLSSPPRHPLPPLTPLHPPTTGLDHARGLCLRVETATMIATREGGTRWSETGIEIEIEIGETGIGTGG